MRAIVKRKRDLALAVLVFAINSSKSLLGAR